MFLQGAKKQMAETAGSITAGNTCLLSQGSTKTNGRNWVIYHYWFAGGQETNGRN